MYSKIRMGITSGEEVNTAGLAVLYGRLRRPGEGLQLVQQVLGLVADDGGRCDRRGDGQRLHHRREGRRRRRRHRAATDRPHPAPQLVTTGNPGCHPHLAGDSSAVMSATACAASCSMNGRRSARRAKSMSTRRWAAQPWRRQERQQDRRPRRRGVSGRAATPPPLRAKERESVRARTKVVEERGLGGHARRAHRRHHGREGVRGPARVP